MNRMTLIGGAATFALVSATVSVAQVPATAGHGTSPVAMTHTAAFTTAQFASAMRQLWEDHIVWTRQFLVRSDG